jgi:hypothetical protein
MSRVEYGLIKCSLDNYFVLFKYYVFMQHSSLHKHSAPPYYSAPDTFHMRDNLHPSRTRKFLHCILYTFLTNSKQVLIRYSCRISNVSERPLPSFNSNHKDVRDHVGVFISDAYSALNVFATILLFFAIFLLKTIIFLLCNKSTTEISALVWPSN